ncbi:MAG: hypothetical protein AAB401_09075 [Acidobacteriota bacterium]
MYTFEYPDEVIKELWKIKEEHAARFNYDIEAMALDLKKEQDASGRKVVSFVEKKEKPSEKELSLAKAS